jgi:hypothetical protein
VKNWLLKTVAALGLVGLLVGGSVVASSAPAQAAYGSVLCNTGSSTIYGVKSGSSTAYGLSPGACAGNHITYIHIPAGQCYAIQRGPTAPYQTACASYSSSLRVSFWAPNAVWFAKRTR